MADPKFKAPKLIYPPKAPSYGNTAGNPRVNRYTCVGREFGPLGRYLRVPIRTEHRKFLRFLYNRTLY